GNGCRPLLHTEQLEQVRSRCLWVHADVLQSDMDLLSDMLRALVLRESTVVAEQVHNGMIRDRTAVGYAPPFQICDSLLLQALSEFVQRSGFPATGFGNNPYHLSLTIFHLLEEFIKDCQVSFSPHQLAQGPFATADDRGTSGQCADDLIDGHRLRLAFHLDWR